MSSKATMQAYADHFGVSRLTIHVWLRKYNEANKEDYNPKDIQSVFRFLEYLQKQFYTASFHKARDRAVL
jgi:hypothetical protein